MNNTLFIVAYQYSHTYTNAVTDTHIAYTQTLRTCWCLNLWCSDYMYVVIAFPDREFALHMFTVSVPKAAAYFFCFFSGVYNCKTDRALLSLRYIHGG